MCKAVVATIQVTEADETPDRVQEMELATQVRVLLVSLRETLQLARQHLAIGAEV